MMTEMTTFTFDALDPLDKIAAAYREYGVVVLKKCLPPDVVTTVTKYLTTQLDEISKYLTKFGFHQPLKDLGPAVTALLQSSSALDNEDRHLLMGHFGLAVRLSETLRRIPLAMKPLPVLYELLGSHELFVHMPVNARYILPNQSSSAVPTHQDIAYNEHMKKFCVLWTPFCEIEERCSGMAVYPGSHLLGAFNKPPAEKGGMEWLPKLDMGSMASVPLLPLSPGDVVVFSDTTAHESMPNTSDRIRLNAEVRFFGEARHSSKHYFDLQSGEIVKPQN